VAINKVVTEAPATTAVVAETTTEGRKKEEAEKSKWKNVMTALKFTKAVSSY